MFLTSVGTIKADAKIGEMGFYGGITEGTRLPKSTEILLETTVRKANTPIVYKEIVALTGTPVEVDGLLTVKVSGTINDKDNSGKYTETHTVAPGGTDTDNTISRTITYEVSWERSGVQIKKNFKVTKWTETIRIGGVEYRLQERQSHFDVSSLEFKSAGVTYYKADISERAVYSTGDAGAVTTTDTSGSLYGYDCAWSATETHRLDVQVSTDEWQMRYQVRPSVSVNKTLQYSSNEPAAMSFEGNYREVMQNTSALQYDITVLPRQFYQTPTKGSASIATYNSFEQLFAPNVSQLKGSFAEADIKKLYSMGVLDGDTKFYVPNQAVTRGEFTTMLVKAIKLPIDTSYQTQTARGKKAVPINIVFPDVLPERADYPYIMAAYNAQLAIGRSLGNFYADSGMQREEAIVMIMRALGLSNLGLEPTPITPYADDASISDWAKKDIYAATVLGLIRPDEQGKIYPKQTMTKAEAAVLINQLIEYMRSGIQLDYTDHIVNYTT